MKKAIFTTAIVLIIDQALKIWVKTNFHLGEEIEVLGDWFLLHFTENEGMAFGMTFGVEYEKIILSVFRIVAVTVIGWYIWQLHKNNAPSGLIITVSLIFAGALGNIIDSAFYGLIFNDPGYQVATIFPEGGGYAGFLHGRVVDMLYFPLINISLPEWLPFLGGERFLFFRPVFNIADSAITLGVFIIILFQKKYFGTINPNQDYSALKNS